MIRSTKTKSSINCCALYLTDGQIIICNNNTVDNTDCCDICPTHNRIIVCNTNTAASTNVCGLCPTESPVITYTENPVDGALGSNVKLSCNIQATPEVTTVVWYRVDNSNWWVSFFWALSAVLCPVANIVFSGFCQQSLVPRKLCSLYCQHTFVVWWVLFSALCVLSTILSLVVNTVLFVHAVHATVLWRMFSGFFQFSAVFFEYCSLSLSVDSINTVLWLTLCSLYSVSTVLCLVVILVLCAFFQYTPSCGTQSTAELGEKCALCFLSTGLCLKVDNQQENFVTIVFSVLGQQVCVLWYTVKSRSLWVLCSLYSLWTHLHLVYSILLSAFCQCTAVYWHTIKNKTVGYLVNIFVHSILHRDRLFSDSDPNNLNHHWHSILLSKLSQHSPVLCIYIVSKSNGQMLRTESTDP